MKFRAGFVSNSSTSSFLGVGFKFPKKPEKIPEKYYEMVRYDKDNEEFFFVVQVLNWEYGEESAYDKFQKKFAEATTTAEKAMEHFKVDAKIAVYGDITDMGGESWLGYMDEEEDIEEEE